MIHYLQCENNFFFTSCSTKYNTIQDLFVSPSLYRICWSPTIRSTRRLSFFPSDYIRKTVPPPLLHYLINITN